jgi:hypothetical protein
MATLYISGSEIAIEVSQLGHDALIEAASKVAASNRPVRQFRDGRFSLFVDFSKVAIMCAEEEPHQDRSRVITGTAGNFSM